MTGYDIFQPVMEPHFPMYINTLYEHSPNDGCE
jgi:hypothetical protein